MVDIYKMKLHDEASIPYIAHVLRVPGGWIYRFWDCDKYDVEKITTFVPFNNEFQNV